MSKKFSNSDDELLIDQVREFPCLYDHENKDFKDFQIRENTWRKIGEVLSKNAEDCKSRWKHIRDNYLKHKRKLKPGTGSASSARPPKWPLFNHLKFLEVVKSERSRIQNCDDEQQEEEYNASHILVDGDVSDSESQNIDEIESNPKTPESTDINPKRTKLNFANTSRSSYIPRSRSSTPSTSSAKARLLQNLEERSNQRMQIVSQLANHKKEEDDVDLFMRSIALTIKKLPPSVISQAKLQILTLVSNLQTSSDAIPATTAAPFMATSSSQAHLSTNPSLSNVERSNTGPTDSSCIVPATPDTCMSTGPSYTLRYLLDSNFQ